MVIEWAKETSFSHPTPALLCPCHTYQLQTECPSHALEPPSHLWQHACVAGDHVLLLPVTTWQVAVKITIIDWAKLEREDGTWVRDNAVREADIMMRLRHPNIVTTYTCKLHDRKPPDHGPQDLNAAPTKAPVPWQLDLVQVSCRSAAAVAATAVTAAAATATLHASRQLTAP